MKLDKTIIYLRPLKRKFDFDVIFCRVVEVSAKS